MESQDANCTSSSVHCDIVVGMIAAVKQLLVDDFIQEPMGLSTVDSVTTDGRWREIDHGGRLFLLFCLGRKTTSPPPHPPPRSTHTHTPV